MSTQMPEPSKDIFVDAWTEMGHEPYEAMSSTQASIAIEMVTDSDGDVLVREGQSEGVLESTSSGLVIADGEPPEPDEPETETDSGEKESEPKPEEMERSELEKEVHELRKEMDAMSSHMDAMNARLNDLTKALVGEESLNVVVDPDNMEDVWSRLNTLSEDVQEHEDKLNMFSKGGGKKKTPDERAQTLRSVLYEKAKSGSSKVGKMTRDECDSALGGGMSRYQLMEAMKRAADGEDADINGSSDLESMDGVEVVVGSGRDEQSKIRMDLAEATAQELRLIQTTEQEGNGVN